MYVYLMMTITLDEWHQVSHISGMNDICYLRSVQDTERQCPCILPKAQGKAEVLTNYCKLYNQAFVSPRPPELRNENEGSDHSNPLRFYAMIGI